MIHRDLCNPKYTKDYSPLRIQFHLLLSRFVCLDGFVPLTRKELADKLSCDIQSVDKFIKKGVRDQIVSLEGDRLFLEKRVDEYTRGYVKHFSFLETDAFKTLNVHTQRFILYTLWAGVHNGRPLKREISSLYHSTSERNGILNIYNKALLYPILEEAKMFLDIEMFTQREKEMFRVKGLAQPFAKEEALENEGEQKWLDDVLFIECCDELINPAARIEILKLKKHYWTSFQSLGLELFCHGLQKLLLTQKLMDLLRQGERHLGAYFFTLLKDMEQKLLPTLQRRLENTVQALKVTPYLFAEVPHAVLTRFAQRKEALERYIQLVKKKMPKNDPPVSFPFFNWLEA